MRNAACFVAAAVIVSAAAHAAEPLDAAAVKALITGKTVLGQGPEGGQQKNYFAPDGKTVRQVGAEIIEGNWGVRPNGMQCVQGMPGACGRIVPNGDGTYNRVMPDGRVAITWIKIVDGKDF